MCSIHLLAAARVEGISIHVMCTRVLGYFFRRSVHSTSKLILPTGCEIGHQINGACTYCNATVCVLSRPGGVSGVVGIRQSYLCTMATRRRWRGKRNMFKWLENQAEKKKRRNCVTVEKAKVHPWESNTGSPRSTQMWLPAHQPAGQSCTWCVSNFIQVGTCSNLFFFYTQFLLTLRFCVYVWKQGMMLLISPKFLKWLDVHNYGK